MAVNLKSLITKLNHPARKGLEAAAGLCASRSHYDVEVEHFLLKLLDEKQGDVHCILKHFKVNATRLSADLSSSIDKLKTGNARNPNFSPGLVKMFSEAWSIGSIDFGATQIRTGYLIMGLIANDDVRRQMLEVSAEFVRMQLPVLKREFPAIVAESMEKHSAATPAGQPGEGARAPGDSEMPHLSQYTVNLTEGARQGTLDPVLGRDFEIRQMVDILTRRRQNNPILTGEAGVGKTAVVEGFALRVAQGDVPPSLKHVAVHMLDLALLQAGAGIRGEFEERLKKLIDEVKSSPKPIILFIDEAHTMIGAGGQAGQGDAANILKPALARGELRTIAATTWSEYKKYFEKDAALSRRFQVVKVDEPDESKCLIMLRGVVPTLEKHHQVRILDEGVSAAVRLSERYISGRQLPDKAVSVLDTACARLALGQNTTPLDIENLTRQREDLKVQQRVLEREGAVGADHDERLGEIRAQLETTESRLEVLEAQYESEKTLVEKIREMRGQLEEAGSANGDVAELDRLRGDLQGLEQQLEAVQGETPLMRVCVDAQIIGEVISGWTGIPLGRMMKDEVESILSLEDSLRQRVIGQDEALKIIGQQVQTSRARLDDPRKPIGVFLLVGPSGVGKTETALALAETLYGGERKLITINMSEFQEAHTVSSLKGSPPGYVGYGEGGVLTEAVRRNPYSVVLLDEAEKAHPDVIDLFYQVFDKGMMEDGEGREIDFKNTVILLASNTATDLMMKLCADPDKLPGTGELVRTLKPHLDKVFKPALLGRLAIVPYLPIRDDTMKRIISLKMSRLQERLAQNHKIELTYEEALLDEVAARCTEVESGARNVDNILSNTLLPDISRELLARIAEGSVTKKIRVGIGEEGGFTYTYEAGLTSP